MANTQVNISANGTTTLATAGKYCDRNIDVNVNVEGVAEAVEFTNVLTHESTTVVLNKYAGSVTEFSSNGEIVVYLDLVALGFNTHPAELTFRWRGMDVTPNNMALYLSQDKSTWSQLETLYSNTLDEYGDNSLYRKINYPTSNRYLKMSFRVKYNTIAVTQEDVDKCILTINEPIGNTLDGITPTGTLSVTENGTYDVTNYASAVVDVETGGGGITPTGTLDVTENGTYDVTNYASVEVDVPSEATPTEFTNLLTSDKVAITINTANTGSTTATRNGVFMVQFNLNDFPHTAGVKKTQFRWRGIYPDTSYPLIQQSKDGVTWSDNISACKYSIDDYGDPIINATNNYPTTYPYIRMSFRRLNAKMTSVDDLAGCVLTAFEPIGNGGYVG